jgi:hypothetical protein
VTRESAITYIATLKKRTGADTTKTTKENHFIYIQKMLRASGVNLFEEGDCPKAPSGSSEDIRRSCYPRSENPDLGTQLLFSGARLFG